MKKSPSALFDTLSYIVEQFKACQSSDSKTIISNWVAECLPKDSVKDFYIKDYQLILNFLYIYRGSTDTFNSYRRELERLVQWSWFMQDKSILDLKRFDIEAFIEFCQKPDPNWIGVKTVAKFKYKNGLRSPNTDWRPFIVKVSKKAFKDGKRPDKDDFEISSNGIKQIFAILGSFYNFLIQEEILDGNPVLQIRQKSKFIQKQQNFTIRRLSDLEWQTVMETAEIMATESPNQHERTLFILNALYGMYLRISELSATARWIPQMNHFERDMNEDWWFKTVGKGNKLRQVAVSPTMLKALKRWRGHLGLSTLPSVDDQSPLIPKAIGKGPIESTRAIRNIVQVCFDKAYEKLIKNNKKEDAEMLRSATVHWLRHTGISDDVKVRPREHVRDDAGHSSGATTDKYIDVELRERAKSAGNKKKIILNED